MWVTQGEKDYEVETLLNSSLRNPEAWAGFSSDQVLHSDGVMRIGLTLLSKTRSCFSRVGYSDDSWVARWENVLEVYQVHVPVEPYLCLVGQGAQN